MVNLMGPLGDYVGGEWVAFGVHEMTLSIEQIMGFINGLGYEGIEQHQVYFKRLGFNLSDIKPISSHCSIVDIRKILKKHDEVFVYVDHDDIVSASYVQQNVVFGEQNEEDLGTIAQDH
ncbi:hypothetical protein SLE2022_232180 [Rubroshorea leprosula]